MRQSHERLLFAKGIVLGKAVSIKGLRVFLAQDQAKNPLLVLRGNLAGPSWPSIAIHLEQSAIEHFLIEAGKTWIVTTDCSTTRVVLQALTTRASQSVREQVLVPDVGFVDAGIKKRVELRVFIGPVALALLSLGLAIVPAVLPESTSEDVTQTPEINCVLDLAEEEVKDWISSSIDSSSSGASGEIALQSKLGVLSLKIEQTIGSTQRVTGSIRCGDGRTKTLHYRLDASANGTLVELSQKLDP